MTDTSWNKAGVLVQVVICIVVGLYTGVTAALLRTAQEQTENSYLPIVVLDTQDDLTPGWNKNTIVIRNIGPGAALNTQRISIPLTNSTIHLDHRSDLPGNTSQEIDAKEDLGSKETPLTESMTEAPWKKGTPQSTIAAKLSGEATVCIAYQNVRGKQFETWQMLSQPSTNNLSVDFICQRKIDTRPACSMSEKIEDVCREEWNAMHKQ